MQKKKNTCNGVSNNRENMVSVEQNLTKQPVKILYLYFLVGFPGQSTPPLSAQKN